MRVFVVMPFGVKQGIDFDQVFKEYLQPAIVTAGLEPFRADEESRAGDIRRDMFQELLLADFAVVDLTIDNPNVWYELGVLHALRPRGVLPVQGNVRERMPFDVVVDRTLRYHLKDGRLDPEKLESDKAGLTAFLRDTIQSWHGRQDSPVYSMLPYLEPPNWKNLRVGGIKEYWDELDTWQQKVSVAQQTQRPGDILVYADEAPTRVLAFEGRLAAAKALLNLEHFRLAYEQTSCALELSPCNLEANQLKGILLGRLGRHVEADVHLRKLVRDNPEDGETWGLVGRVEKNAWVARWAGKETDEERRREAAASKAWLQESIRAYTTGFRKDPGNYYTGVNALTLEYLLQHLTGRKAKDKTEREALEGGVRWAVECALTRNERDYWARVTLADLELLNSSSERVVEAYQDAVAVADNNRFALNSTRQQLALLQSLNFRPVEVTGALDVFERVLAEMPESEDLVPRRVFLFSGHMVDKPDRIPPRFPASHIASAASRIEAKLEELNAGPGDLAICGGACGGDLLFATACLKRGLGLRLRIPHPEPAFIEESVSFAGEDWVQRYYEVKGNPLTTVLVMPERLGCTPAGRSPFARNNVWMLYTALGWGPERLHFLCLWNRSEGDGPGGTKHMHDTVRKHAGHVYVIDTNRL